MQIQWTDLAEDDLFHIEEFIREQNSQQVAVNTVLKVIDTVELILPQHPFAGRNGRVKNTRELVVSGLPFLVIYRFLSEKSAVQILRVLHEKKRWP